MQITITLTEEQKKALLTEYISIEEYCQQVIENRANRIINEIVRDCADGKISTDALTKTEQAGMDKALADRIIIHSSSLPKEVKALIMKKAKIPTMVEKIAAQEEMV